LPANYTVLKSDLLGILQNPVQELGSQFRFGSLSSSEHDGYLDLVAVTEEPLDVPHLETVIVNADLGSEFDLFDLNLFLMLLRLMSFFM